MRSWGLWALVILVGCGGERERGFIDGATTTPPDGGTTREDAEPPPADAAVTDSSAPPPTVCEPTVGSETLSGYCQQVMISVLRQEGLPTAVEARGITTSVGDGCRIVDRVELVSRAGVVQTLTGLVPEVRPGTDLFVARADEASPELSALCDDDEGRYDAFEVVVHGRTDGGSFTARCGADLGGGFGWPPDSVVTCHRNLPVGPTFMGDAQVESGTGFTWSTIWFSYPNERGLSIDSLASDVRIVPTADPFGGGFVEPILTSGWDTSISFHTSAERYLGVQLGILEDAFGPETCPAVDPTGEPPETFPPVLMLHLSGSGAAGAFESEAYVNSCYRISIMP